MRTKRRDWHAVSVEDSLQELDASPDGLDAESAAQRLETFGPNQLPAGQRRTLLQRFLHQFRNMLIYVLLAAAAVTAALGHWLDTVVILGVVVINAVIGVIQEGRAEKALDAIRGMLSPRATVLRDGARSECPAEELVPGDVVLLRSGDRVPADLRLLKVRDLRVEEAALTGESVPVAKDCNAVAEDTPLGDRAGMAYSGTLVRAGTAQGLVVATGAATEIGRISEMIADVEQITTPLLKQMEGFARTLAVAVVGVALATFVVAVLLRGYPLAESFMAAVGLAVAAIPEGLPAIMTITLAIGVQRMASRNAIIRHLPAVETLGSVTVICSDKTGTLTRNAMTVKSILLADAVVSVSGVGYAPDGEIDADDRPDSDDALDHLLHVGVLCNDSRVFRTDDDGWDIEGDPTEAALLTLARKSGLEPDDLTKRYSRLDTLPFESEHQYMATLHEAPDAGRVVFLKGAPERVLAMCDRQLGPDGPESVDHAAWERAMDEAADRGQRLLALAMKEAADGQSELAVDHIDSGLLLLGVVGMIDPPSEEAISSVATCQSAGIRVVMITGDHARTASAIGRELGICKQDDPVRTGADIEALEDHELSEVIRDVNVFARASPEHKLRLVRSLQAIGQVVAMTGDGVNDAPALKRADVGVAMGKRGTEVSKEASAMVLADDNFASIGRAVEEGRTVYDNLRKALLFMLPTNGGQAGIILLAVAAGMVLPVTPVQILWVNMVTAVTLALALAFEPTERGVMARSPRHPDAPILGRFLLWRIAFVSSLLVAVTLTLFWWHHVEGDEALARTVAVNTLVVCQAFYLLSVRFMQTSAINPGVVSGNVWVPSAIAAILLLQIGFTYLPPMQFLFETQPLGAEHWLLMLLAGVLVFLAVEAEKWLVSAWSRRQ